MIIKNYNYDLTEISTIALDTYYAQHLWIAYKQDADGICLLRKVSANDPNQIFFDVEITTNEIKKIYCSELYMYVALDDDTYFGKRYNVTNPFSSAVNLAIPSGITEAPIDILYSTYVYFLIPGNNSGTNTKIVKFNTSGVFQETIDLATINNAISFTRDSVTGDIWVITYENPSKYIRVYYSAGWHYTVNY